MIKKLFILILCLLVLIPATFAMDNSTLHLNDENQEILAGSNDYYFNASVLNDGDGSVESPYRNLENNVKANSVNHLANGEYKLEKELIISDVSFMGQDASKTVINCQGEVLNVTKILNLKNVTLTDFTIINKGTLKAENTIFSHGWGKDNDKYGNSRGGAIYSPYDASKKFKVTIDNCIFENNYAEYGGAIYMDGGELNITNSQFINNTAYSYGGAIACEYNTKLNITRTKFINSRSLNDAGGSIYLKMVNFTSNRMEITNSSSTFGGAITALNSNMTLLRLNITNNNAEYDGGAIYQLYGRILLQQSVFINNSAKNGGALFLDNLTSILVASNQFENNTAKLCAGAFYSLANPKLNFKNIFTNNFALTNNDLYETDSFDISDIGNGNYTIFINNDTWEGIIPRNYSLYNEGLVSSIKNQQYGGNCWAFAALASLESCILKASGREYDLSEENMKNLIELYSDYGWAMDTNEGGYNNMAIGYLTSWLGPIEELNGTYDDFSTLSPLLNSLFHVQNVLFLKRDNFTDNDAIKKAILRYGGVATGICYYEQYLKENSYYCYKIFDYPNHAVTIVGWDDDYSKDNFWGNPENDGAWIVKNSWGESWGDDGFFYVSYCDKKLAQVGVGESAYTFILNDSMRYSRNYQYDVIGKTNYFTSNENEIYYQNTFKSTANELLAAVSTHFEKASLYDLSVYVNDKLKLNQSGVSDAGYYTIRLDQMIPIYEGDSFKVIFRISGNGSFRVPISEKSYSNKFLSKEGISFFSYNGVDWFDLYTSSAPSVASIKAFTVQTELDTRLILNISENQSNPVEIRANIFDEFENPVDSGNITFIIEDTPYVASVENGLAIIKYNFTDGGLKSIHASFEGILYSKSNSSSVFNVDIRDTCLIGENLIKYFGNSTYSVRLIDDKNNPVYDKKIIFTINGTDYESKTDKDGFALINFEFDIGEYLFDFKFSGDEKYLSSSNTSKIIVRTSIIPTNMTNFTLNSNCSVKLLDSNGSDLANRQVAVYVNSKSYNLSADENGDLAININLKPGLYSLRIVNPDTGEEIVKNITVVSRITGNKDLTMYYGAGKSFKIRIFDDNGNPLKSGVSIKFSVSGKSVSKKTDKNGYVTYKIALNAGKYTISCSYKGFKISNKITVKPTLITSNKSVKKGKTLKFTAKLLNSKGKILKGKKISFKFKGKKYTVKTNKIGIATLKLKITKVGKYVIETRYGKVIVKNKITVKRK